MVQQDQKILVLLDFDDTIVVSAVYFWKNYADFLTYLYEEIIKEKGDNPYSHTPTIQEALRTLETLEAEFLPTHGFTPDRMIESFKRVLMTFNIELTDERCTKLVAFAHAPFAAKLTLNENVKSAIIQLSQFAKIVIWTRGKQEIQARRIQSIGMDEYIKSIWAFQEKTSEKLETVIREEIKEMGTEYDSDDMEIWMIGNSIEHDILPAMNIGINAILVGATGGSSNWFRNFITADNMQRAVDLIIGKSDHADKKTLTQMFR